MPIITDLDKFRLELGDINPDAPLFNDDEAQYFIDRQPSSILLAAADACDSLARRFAREFDFDTTSEKSFKRSQKAKAFADAAKELRARAKLESAGGLGVIITTRADGYADDLDTRNTTGLIASTGRTGYRGTYDEDLP